MSTCPDLRNQLAEYHQVLLNKSELANKLASIDQRKLEQLSQQLKTRWSELDIHNLREQIRELDYDGDLNLSHITNHTQLQEQNGFVFPRSVSGNLQLNGIESAAGLVLPKYVHNLILSDLTDTKGLIFPEKIDGLLDLRNLTSARGLVLPEILGGSLILAALISAEGVKFPKKVGGYLSLYNLTSAKGLVLPEEIEGDLYLRSLTSAEGLELPEKITDDVCLSHRVYDELVPKLTPEQLRKYKFDFTG